MPYPTDFKATILASCRKKKLNITALRETVLDIALNECGVIKAYHVLAQMQAASERTIAPPTVYRSLDFWAQVGVLHKVDAVNGYIVCRHQHQHDDSHEQSPFVLVCKKCGAVFEPDFTGLSQSLAEACAAANFHSDGEAVVVTGECAFCSRTPKVNE